jgi:hypothetical protein
MNQHSTIWVYPKRARRLGDRYEIPGSRDNDRVVVLLDQPIVDDLPADALAELEAMRSRLQAAAERLFENEDISKVSDQTAPQFFHWQIVVTKADLDLT